MNLDHAKAKNFFEISAALFSEKKPFVTVTLVSARGHTPQDPGAKIIVTTQGLLWGTVGGGKVEARAILQAKEMLSTSIGPISAVDAANKTPASFLHTPAAPELLTWNLQRDIGMTCGGEVTYLFELHKPVVWQVAVFGAGHVAQALVRTLLPLNCSVVCTDARSEWTERLPQASNLVTQCLPNPADAVAKLSENTFFVVMTQGHAFDVPILNQIFRSHANCPYIGVIGSTLKGTKIKNELRDLGIDPELLTRLRCPVGLELGSNDPAEIAISIVAELIQVRDRN